MTREEKIAKVLEMWDAKYTSYQIAQEVDITRNAVMGIVHRHGKRKNPKKAIVKRVTPKVKTEKAAPKAPPKKRAATKKEEKLTVFKKRIKATEPFPELTFKKTKGKKILELGLFDCRWIWDDGSYCAKPAIGCSYCAYHKAIVYVPPKKRERA